MCECGNGGKQRRGMCGACYARWLRKQKKSLKPNLTVEQRYWLKVQKGPGCWEWTASKTPKGYGQFSPHRAHVYAHRFAYELEHGSPVPAGLTIDHLCGNRGCVNPAHLEVVTRGENTARAQAPQSCRFCGQVMKLNNMRQHVAARHGMAGSDQ